MLLLTLFTNSLNTRCCNTLTSKPVKYNSTIHHALPVALCALSTTFEWPLLFFASFLKYSTTFITICFDWLVRGFPVKEYFSCTWESSPLSRLTLEVAVELNNAIYYVHIKGKVGCYIITRAVMQSYDDHYVMTNWWSL